MGKDDRKIVRAVKGLIRGRDVERNAHTVHRHYYQAVVHFFIRKGLKEADAEDLAQEAFDRLFRTIRTFRYECGIHSWIFRIAKHTYLNHLRSLAAQKRCRNEVSIDDPEACSDAMLKERRGNSPPDALGSMLLKETLDKVEAVIDALSPQRRICLLMHVAQGLKYREIARLLQISIGTVRSHIAQARREIRTNQCVEAAGQALDGGECDDEKA